MRVPGIAKALIVEQGIAREAKVQGLKHDVTQKGTKGVALTNSAMQLDGIGQAPCGNDGG